LGKEIEMTETENKQSKILEQVKDILWELHLDEPELVSLRTELYRDLGIDGDDAVEIFEKIEEMFQVDFSNIQWDQHFVSEPEVNPFALITRKWSKWQRERVPVTVQDLIDAICEKQWVKEYSAGQISQTSNDTKVS